MRSLKVKRYSNAIDAGVKRFSEFGVNHLIPHFIICNIDEYNRRKEIKQIYKEIFSSEMRKYGMSSAFLTMLSFKRLNAESKEAVEHEFHPIRLIHNKISTQLKNDNGENENHFSDFLVLRLLSEDLEEFYTGLQNPKRQLEKHTATIFLKQKLTEEEQTKLKNRNKSYLKTFEFYKFIDNNGIPFWWDVDMHLIRESSDPESIFCYSYGGRWTSSLHVNLKSMQGKMR